MTALAPAPGAEVADGAAPAPPARVAAVLAVLVALAGAVLGPTGGLDVLLDPQRVTVADGVVERQLERGWAPVAPGTRVADGTTLRAPDGAATLRVAGGAVDLADGSQVVTGETLRVDAGTVVVRSAGAVVGDDGATAQGPGTWRWDATGRVGAYAGSVVVTDATGRDVLVRGLEQSRVRDNVVADTPRPYVYSDADAFDRTHLATAFRVDDYVAALHGGLAADYGTAPQRPAFYTDFDGLDGQLVSALGDVGFDRVEGRIGPPADVLVAAVVTDALVVEAALAPQEAADEVRDKRLAGATWGLIALARDLDAGAIRAAAERALARRQLAEQQGTAAPVITSPPATPASAAPPPSTPTPTTPDADDQPPTSPPGRGDGGSPADRPGPGTSPPPEEDPGLLGSIVDGTGAGDLLGDELGGLVDDVVKAGDDLLDGPDTGEDASRDPEPKDGGVLDTTGELVEDTVDTVEGAVGSLLGSN